MSALVTAHHAIAATEGDNQSCVDAYEAAQRAKRSGQLLEARRQLLTCGGAECPTAMHGDCERWLTEVEASTPTVVFRLDSDRSDDLANARISIDGRAALALDGRAISFDLGEHTLRFFADGHEPLSRHFVFSEGEKLRRVAVTLKATKEGDWVASVPKAPRNLLATDQSPKERSRISAPVILAGSVALLGAVGFGYFGLVARAQDRSLGDCTPYCGRERIDDTRRDYLYANTSLAVGATGMVVAVVLMLVNPGQDDDAKGVKPSRLAGNGAYRDFGKISF